MMIVRCPECSSRFKAPDNMAGQAVRCAKCKTAFTLPRLEADEEEIEELQEAPPGRRSNRDDDDRPTSRRRDPRDDDYDDEDQEDRERRRAKSQAAAIDRARLAMLLLFIGSCLFLGGLGIEFFFLLLQFCNIAVSGDLFALSGLTGLGGWITGAVGLGFLVAGPAKYGARGLAIALAAVGGVHLLFLLIAVFQSTPMGPFDSGMRINWARMVTYLPYLIHLPTYSRIQVDALGLLAGVLELARLVLLGLTVRAVALNVKESHLADNAMKAMIVGASVVVGLLFLMLILRLILQNISAGGVSGAKAIFFVLTSLPYFGLLGIGAFYTYVLNDARNSIYPPRKRK